MDIDALVQEYLSEKRKGTEKEKTKKVLSSFFEYLEEDKTRLNYYKDFSVDDRSLPEAVENDTVLFIISTYKSAPQKAEAMKS